MNEILKGIQIPILADSVLSPQIHYGEPFYNEPYTGIYFNTEDEQYGRIVFENMDAIKVCRGEMFPYSYNWDDHISGTWVFQVENSAWQRERYEYEKKHYGRAYEFGGDVNDMLSEFKHYLFSFHDQFIEVITRGFWFEKDKQNLFGTPLTDGHPFLSLPVECYEVLEYEYIKTEVRRNPKPIEQLINDAKYCSQKLMEFAIVLDDSSSVTNALYLTYKGSELVSSLKGYFGRKEVTALGVVDLKDIEPYIIKYMKEVYKRRKQK